MELKFGRELFLHINEGVLIVPYGIEIRGR